MAERQDSQEHYRLPQHLHWLPGQAFSAADPQQLPQELQGLQAVLQDLQRLPLQLQGLQAALQGLQHLLWQLQGHHQPQLAELHCLQGELEAQQVEQQRHVLRGSYLGQQRVGSLMLVQLNLQGPHQGLAAVPAVRRAVRKQAVRGGLSTVAGTTGCLRQL